MLDVVLGVVGTLQKHLESVEHQLVDHSNGIWNLTCLGASETSSPAAMQSPLTNSVSSLTLLHPRQRMHWDSRSTGAPLLAVKALGCAFVDKIHHQTLFCTP